MRRRGGQCFIFRDKSKRHPSRAICFLLTVMRGSLQQPGTNAQETGVCLEDASSAEKCCNVQMSIPAEEEEDKPRPH